MEPLFGPFRFLYSYFCFNIGREKEKMLITSHQNPRFKRLLALRQRRKGEKEGLFLIEGAMEVAMAIKGGVEIASFHFSPPLLRKDGERLLQEVSQAKVPWVELAPPLFQRVSYRDTPDGVLAVARRYKKGLRELSLGKNPLIVVVEALEKPGNLGAILRTGDAGGVNGVVVCDPVVDLFNPNVIRASRGTLFTLQVAVTSSQDALKWLKEQGIGIVVTTPHASAEYTQVNYANPKAIVAGSEHEGLKGIWMEAADHVVRIPMLGKADSLNVATTVAVVLYEALRQRRSPAPKTNRF